MYTLSLMLKLYFNLPNIYFTVQLNKYIPRLLKRFLRSVEDIKKLLPFSVILHMPFFKLVTLTASSIGSRLGQSFITYC